MLYLNEHDEVFCSAHAPQPGSYFWRLRGWRELEPGDVGRLRRRRLACMRCGHRAGEDTRGDRRAGAILAHPGRRLAPLAAAAALVLLLGAPIVTDRANTGDLSPKRDGRIFRAADGTRIHAPDSTTAQLQYEALLGGLGDPVDIRGWIVRGDTILMADYRSPLLGDSLLTRAVPGYEPRTPLRSARELLDLAAAAVDTCQAEPIGTVSLTVAGDQVSFRMLRVRVAGEDLVRLLRCD